MHNVSFNAHRRVSREDSSKGTDVEGDVKCMKTGKSKGMSNPYTGLYAVYYSASTVDWNRPRSRSHTMFFWVQIHTEHSI